jgi:hypothetical protein
MGLDNFRGIIFSTTKSIHFSFKKFIADIHFSFKYFFIAEVLSPVIVLTLFHLNEIWASKFYLRFYKEIGFVSPFKRVNKTNIFLDDFFTQVEGLASFQEINIVMRGDSVTEFSNNINYKLPTFYVNFYKKGKADKSIYITADGGVYVKMKKLNLYPTILITDTKEIETERATFANDVAYHSKNSKFLDIFQKDKKIRLCVSHKAGAKQLGSGLGVIACLASTAKKVNVYGHDAYFGNNISNISYFQCLISIYRTPDSSYRRLKLIAEKFLNLYYVKIMLQDEKFNVYSFLGNVDSQAKLFDKIDRMLSKPKI